MLKAIDMRAQVQLLSTIIGVLLIGVAGAYVVSSFHEERQTEWANSLGEGQGLQPPDSHADSPTGNERAGTTSASDTSVSSGPIVAEATDLSIGELVDAMMQAADREDMPALEQLRRTLATRNDLEVLLIAKQRLELERLDGHPRSTLQRSLRVANLLMLVAPLEPPCALSELRRRWSRPAVDEGRLDRWTKLDSGPQDIPAWRALDDYDRIEACGIGDVIKHGLYSKPYNAVALVDHLQSIFSEGVPDGEIPDPWLSQLVLSIGNFKSKFSADAWLICRSWLRSISDSAAFSNRLRRQAAILCVDAPAGYWEFLDLIRDGYTLEETAEAFWQYLQNYNISDDELDMMLAVLIQMYGKLPDDYRQFMATAMLRSSGSVEKKQWREVASTLLRVSLQSENADHCDLSIRMMYGMVQEWGSTEEDSTFPEGLFSNSTTSLTDLLALHHKTISNSGKLPEGSGSFGTARLIEIVFYTGGAVDEQLVAATAMVTRREALDYVEFLGVINGLAHLQGRLVNADGVAVAALLDATFDRYDFLKLKATPEEQRPVRPDMGETLIVVSIAETLLACGLPVLQGKALAQVSSLARIVVQDSKHWADKRWRFVSPEQIEHFKEIARDLVEAYHE
ncbi:MAG: hypothetical protein K8I27_11505 [Planctomycetes bacterium]|nr:hypothetical protein [Planctomycetota bacterium]